MMMSLCKERERVVARPKKESTGVAAECQAAAQLEQRLSHAARRTEHGFAQSRWVRAPDVHHRPERHLAAMHEVTPEKTLPREFERLAQQWRGDMGGVSAISRLVLHPAYQRIIGLGPEVVPLLLKDLEAEPEHWTPALSAITGENPIPPEAAGNLKAMAAAWVKWGKQRGILT